jgi:hypothetical protein
VSSAILYLAIVAIWAVVLVPRWLHPRSSVHRQSAAIQNEVPAPEGEQDKPTQELGSAETGTGVPPAHAAAPAPPAPSPATRRAHMLQARRRTLGTLVLLTLGALVFAVTHPAAAWIIAPPSIMLAGFLVLLREAALIDAERRRQTTVAPHSAGRSGADASGRAGGAAPRAAQTPGPVTPPEPGTGGTTTPETNRPAEPDTATGPAATGTYGVGPRLGAHVIDISDRIDGQFYDQYTDAVDRAVGD